MTSSMQTIATAVGIIAILLVIVGSVDGRYIPRVEAYTRVEAKRHEDLSLQIHTQLNMMLLEERLRRYREESGSGDMNTELKQIQARLEALDGLFRKQLLQDGLAPAIQMGVQ